MPARALPLVAAALGLLAAPPAAQRGDAPFLRYRSLEAAGVPRRTAAEAGVAPSARVPRRAAGAERPNVMLTGYWPPSNEAIRPFSTDPVQNPGGWIGSDWEGRGYDVHAFFPEFSDPACTNDCGQGTGDLEVDYQDTSADFWAIADALEPIAVVTFSRGFADASWELELNQYNRDAWIPDFAAPKQPTPSPPNPDQPAGALLTSTLPLQHVVDSVAAAHPALEPFICVSEDGGGFLSEFAAYHGVWYQDEHDDPLAPDWCVAAGHVHVGGQVGWADARAAAETTLHGVLDLVDHAVDPGPCAPDLGFQGPGTAELSLCGGLSAGGAGTLSLVAPPQKAGWLFVSAALTPVPVGAGTLAALPYLVFEPLGTGPTGEVHLFDAVPGGGGPLTLYAQYVLLDPTLPGNLGFSNAVEIEILP